ncbi:unnamed protein product, partial [Didymodactylos carnosus]
IDHRQFYNITKFKNALTWIEQTGSAATLIGLLYRNINQIPTTLTANLIYLAIMSNTIRCKSHNTTKYDLSILNWLSTIININDEFVNQMFKEKSIINNIYKVIDEDTITKLEIIHNKKTAISQLEIINVEEFLQKNKLIILDSLDVVKQNRQADSIFINLIDTITGKTYFIFSDQIIEEIVKSVIHNIVKKKNNYYYQCDDIFLRKEIIALIMNKNN